MTSAVCFQDVTPLQIVYPDTALRLQALLDFQDHEGLKRVAGDEWLFEGPGRSCLWPKRRSNSSEVPRVFLNQRVVWIRTMFRLES